jgi:hypothetical protein
MSGPGVPTRPGVRLDPSLYPFESTLNGQHEDHALSRFSNILEFITCHLIRHKSARMPPKVPSPLSLIRRQCSDLVFFDATLDADALLFDA